MINIKSTAFSLLLFFSLLTTLQAQTTVQSCDCQVDLTGFLTYLNSLNLNENSPLTFSVPDGSSTYAVLHGVIDGTTPNVVQSFINTYPNVTTLVFMQMPGSDDDTANLQASQLLKNQGYTTYLPAVNAYPDDAFIASGAIDMFLAGNKRIIDVNGEVGVHSWSDGTNEATDFPVGNAVHQPYIDYYVSMGFSQEDAESFYYFTINAATANAIHNMTEAELEQYKMRTCTFNANPAYTATATDGTLSADLAGAIYQWLDCDNGNAEIIGATNRVFIPTTSGNYAVNVTENDCSGTSDCYSVSVTSSTNPQLATTMKVYPNPTNGLLVLDTENTETTTVQLLDNSGRIVSISMTNDNSQTTLDLSDLSNGVYFLTVRNSKEVEVFSVIVE